MRGDAARRPEEKAMKARAVRTNASYDAAEALEFFRSVGKPEEFVQGKRIFAESEEASHC
jgi:hypothetical protein